MKCEGCKYLGMYLKHLDGLEGVACWYGCDYPLPFHVIPKAVRVDVEHNCKVYQHTDEKMNPCLQNHELWKHLHDEHGLILIESELDEIVKLASQLCGR